MIACTAVIQKGLMRAQDLTAVERRERGERGESALGRERYLEAHVYWLPEEGGS